MLVFPGMIEVSHITSKKIEHARGKMGFSGQIPAQGVQNKNDVLIAMDGSKSSLIAIAMVSHIAQDKHYLYNNYGYNQSEIGPISPPPMRFDLTDI